MKFRCIQFEKQWTVLLIILSHFDAWGVLECELVFENNTQKCYLKKDVHGDKKDTHTHTHPVDDGYITIVC